MPQLTPDQEKLAPLLDRAMVDILEHGVKVQTGTDKDGKPVVETLTPSAATLNIIRQRIKDLGITSLPAAGTPAADLLKEAQARGLRYDGAPVPSAPMPPISEDDDAAVG